MRKRFLVVISVLMLIGTSMTTVATAEIYRHVDNRGQVTYTNTRLKGAEKVYLKRKLAKAKTSAPKNFPRVNRKVQKKRDLKRRNILNDELAAEEKLLFNAKQTFKKDDVSLHRRNIIALKKELKNL
jgi:formylmethanofuran dehydrogenase subunit E